MKYRKKPVEVEAWQYTGNPHDATLWAAVIGSPATMWVKAGLLYIPTLEGEMLVQPGDWIIKGVKDELYPCKPDIFAATYEKIENS